MISVIINVYNGEKFIKKCLDSIVNQTYKDLEIIIVNDGSTDNTLKMCESYKDKRIRIISTEKKGLALSRNVGIDNANGEYLYFVDVDDFIELDTLEYLYNICKKYNTEIATSRALEIDNYNTIVKNYRPKVKVISNKEMLEKILLWDNRAEAVWNKLIKKDLFENLRFEDRLINDIAFTYKLVLKANTIAYSNQIKYYHFKHENSISKQKIEDFDRSIDLYKISFERYEYIRKVFPNFTVNKIGVFYIISRLYLRKNEKIIEYLNNQNAVSLANKMFTLKLFKCKLGFREKIKLVLFRINPNLYKKTIEFYLKLKRKIIR